MWRAAVALSLTLVVAAGKDGNDFSVAICGAAPDGSRASADALATVAALAVQATGVGAHVLRECFQPPSLTPSYMKTIRNLTSTTQPHAHVALLVVSATNPPSAPLLEEVGLEQLGDAAPPWRRTCFVSDPPARSLLDFTDPTLATFYHLPPENLHTILKYKRETLNFTVTPEWCKSLNSTCATLLTSDEVERDILKEVVNKYRLYAEVYALGAGLAGAAAALSRPLLVCDSAVELSPLGRLDLTPLGPPPCHGLDTCPFEPLRLIKIANVKSLLQYRSAHKALIRLHFDTSELVNLTIDARLNGPEKAAKAFIRDRPFKVLPDEVRVAVLVPKNTTRDTYEFRSFEEAAKLVENSFRTTARLRFKVQVIDDRCSGQKTYQFLTNSVGTSEYGALSAVAGPACGEAFEKMADLALLHVLPLLAYTPQAPPRAADGLALLAAGDARRNNDLWFALLNTMKWRRLAVISEKATYESLSRLSNFSIFQLHDDNDSVDKESISQWAIKTAEENFKILYPCLEDARKVRATLCAGHAAGLTPRRGAVWLLPSALPARWWRPAPGEEPGCSPEELAEMTEGHLRSAPAWETEWTLAKRYEWARLCPNCDASAALLYDILKLWATTVLQLIDTEPTALNDLHQYEYLKSIIINITTSTNYSGLTGRFEWTFADGAYARSTPHVVQQWRNGSYETVGRWENGLLSLNVEALRWGTDDGRTPTDGSEHCGLQPLAKLLGSDCRTAFIVLAALLLSALVGALAAFALYCRRRAEREYRAHLEALRLRTFGLKPGGLDRWEVPRERVVINRKLGTGAFGTVYGGHALLAEDRGWTAVAVKTLKAGASTEEKLDFLSEAEAMKRFDHKNVVRLLAVVTKTEPVCTVMEFMLYGDLKNYLLARRHLATETGMGAYGDEAAEEVSPRRLTAMALDAARALSYLAQLRYVHRDVAARNCLVSAHRVVKLADFGMTRLVFENDYYRFSRKGMLPVRWMAPESLALGVFSPASDVWSFGVLLYEIVTFGSLPFQGLSNSEVLGRVKAGHTLDLPTGLKPQLEGLIKSCWRQEAKARPMAAEVAAFLADSPRLLAPCLDVPLDALPLDPDPPWRAARDRAEARWVSWAAPASATTDTTYLSADARPPSETDAFLSAPATP